MSSEFLVIDSNDTKTWQKVIISSIQYDFYHTNDYHKIEEAQGNGKPVLLVYKESEYHIALPLLLRNLKKLDFVNDENLFDACSVYGYVGPIYSHENISLDIIERFQLKLKQYFQENNVINVFSRFHPLIEQSKYMAGLGEICNLSDTISINLTLSYEDRWQKYRKNHKRNIIKLRTSDINCQNVPIDKYLKQFIDIYYENMDRVNADYRYYFDEDYFRNFIKSAQYNSYLFISSIDDTIISGVLIVSINDIIQYHVGATKYDFLHLSPMKQNFHEICNWGHERRMKTFHLGGGVGSKEDSVLKFKSGFSDLRHQFKIWRWVINNEKYEEICQLKDLNNKLKKKQVIDSNYFPYYRALDKEIE